MIDHFGFPVSDYERSKAFYAGALAPLGYVLIMEVDQAENNHRAAGFGRNGKTDLWIGGEGGLDGVLHLALAADDPALLMIQRIRDEAHRFAVTFHRRARTMRDLRSELDEVPGVGPRRRRTLLTTFGSLAGVRRATREELAASVGAKVADRVLAFFASRP